MFAPIGSYGPQRLTGWRVMERVSWTLERDGNERHKLQVRYLELRLAHIYIRMVNGPKELWRRRLPVTTYKKSLFVFINYLYYLILIMYNTQHTKRDDTSCRWRRSCGWLPGARSGFQRDGSSEVGNRRRRGIPTANGNVGGCSIIVPITHCLSDGRVKRNTTRRALTYRNRTVGPCGVRLPHARHASAETRPNDVYHRLVI